MIETERLGAAACPTRKAHGVAVDEESLQCVVLPPQALLLVAALRLAVSRAPRKDATARWSEPDTNFGVINAEHVNEHIAWIRHGLLRMFFGRGRTRGHPPISAPVVGASPQHHPRVAAGVSFAVFAVDCSARAPLTVTQAAFACP